MKVEVIGGSLKQEEIDRYIEYIEEKNQGEILNTLTLTVDGEYVDMQYTFKDVPFERIRRITGYLVGTVDRFNNAKRAEVRDRTKHSELCV
ncbi:MAG: anaerobic ribonucleoside-triphosphate reductase [Clostridia bacterium]